MKVRTVAGLAALGMTLTSYSVWSLTDPDRALLPDAPLPFTGPVSLPSPDGPAAFHLAGTLDVTGRVGNATLASDRDSETFVLVNVRADERGTARSAERHLSIVIDRSGSMQGKKLDNALAAARGAVERLNDGDTVSIVDYATTAHELVPPTRLDSSSRFRINQELGRLTASGDTCISCALEMTRNMVRFQSGTVERVLLLSDGEATTGLRDVESMRGMAQRLRDVGATVTTIGVDVDYNERMMAAIAQEANGRHYFVATPDGLGRIFDAELRGLERTVARDARLELDFAPGVELVEVVDHSIERQGSRAIVRLGTFAAGEERTVLARVRVPRGAPGERGIVTASIAYDDLQTGSDARQRAELAVRMTSDGSSSPLDPLVKERVDRSGTVTALDEANRLFESGDAVAARRRVADALDGVRKGRAAAVEAAPEPEKKDLDESFARQEAALGSAAGGFAAPPPAVAATPAELRASKSVLKQNQAEASDLAR